MGEGFAQVRALYLANQDLPFRKENISVIEKEKNLQKDASFWEDTKASEEKMSHFSNMHKKFI